MGHLRENGFSVMTKDLGDAELSALKARHGVGRELAGCHTAEIEGYVIEGHVHAREIVRLLEERPEIAGLSVPGMPVGSPGMPVGSPGMEVPSGRKDPHAVLAFDSEGRTSVYARY